jgi:hypothetical protein
MTAVNLTTGNLVYAATRDGGLLPVIDVTNPRFAVADDPSSLNRLLEASAKEEQSRRWVPRFIMRMMMRSLVRKSLIAKALFSSGSDFLPGLSTYVMKLGPDNLPPPYDGATDRRFAASAHLTLLRLRTQQTARLIVDGLVKDLTDNGAPLHLINIAGGPAVDSLNAVILLRRDRPDLLRRKIDIDVFDLDDEGPIFGANALTALAAAGRPLAGLDMAFVHRRYDWNDPAALASHLAELSQAGAVTAASSEGGLFEYGEDDAIVANLKALHAGGVRLIAGSVTNDDEARRRMVREGGFKLKPRGVSGFRPLAARGGFNITRTEPGHFSTQVQLRPL